MRKNIFILIVCLLIILSSLNTNNVEIEATYYSEIIYSGSNKNKRVYLTFDDGCTTANTNKILEALIEKDIPATFFLDGIFLDNNPLLVKKIYQANYIIGCHTWSHKDITKMSDKKFRKEIDNFEARYKEITNDNLVKFFRPPMGIINQQKINILKEYNYDIFYWNVSYYDYNRRNDLGVNYAYDQIISQVKNGSIILMHTLVDSNALVLPKVINTLLEMGYTFGSLKELATYA